MSTEHMLILVQNPDDETRMRIDDFLSYEDVDFAYVVQPDTELDPRRVEAHTRRSTMFHLIDQQLDRLIQLGEELKLDSIVHRAKEAKLRVGQL